MGTYVFYLLNLCLNLQMLNYYNHKYFWEIWELL